MLYFIAEFNHGSWMKKHIIQIYNRFSIVEQRDDKKKEVTNEILPEWFCNSKTCKNCCNIKYAIINEKCIRKKWIMKYLTKKIIGNLGKV